MPPSIPSYLIQAFKNEDEDEDEDELDEGDDEFKGWKDDLAKRIEAIEAYGDFASQKTYTTFVNPGLEVADVKIPLPLPDLYADQIKAVARSAPFGRGDETVVDHSVRLTWELNHDEFRITNPSWKGFLDTIVCDAANGLGLKPEEVRVEPYKLLLYERGSFFKPHKDSEKTPGMIGSMVVCLPSPHGGGEVHLSHMGKKSVFVTAPSSSFDLKMLTWYSDVTHEVKEVTSGHRLALTYNIIQTTGPGKSATLFIQQQTQLRDLLRRWSRDFSTLERLVLLTDHKYTPDSLSASNLMKGRDRAVFESLRNVCAETDLYICLANIQKSVSDDDYDSEDEDICLDYLCSSDGIILAQNVTIYEGDIITPDPYGGRNPDKTEEGEFTGNESQPTMFRYYNSAIVLIPRDKIHKLFTYYNLEAVVPFVMGHYFRNPSDSGLRDHAIGFMNKALSHPNASAINATTIAFAWTINNDELYRNTVRSYTKSGKVPDELVEKLALVVNTASSKRALDWQRRWWELFLAPVDLTSLFNAADKFETLLENDDTKASFKSWAVSSKRRLFESKHPLKVSDIDGVMTFAISMRENRVWINEELVPKLQESQDKAVISKVIDLLMQKDCADVLTGAENIAKGMLDSRLSRLHLGDVNFWIDGDTSSAGGDFVLYRHESHQIASLAEVNRFLRLVKTCLKHGWGHEASELSKLSYEYARQKGPKPHPQRMYYNGLRAPALASYFVSQLAKLSHAAPAPFIEQQQKLVEFIFRFYIIGTCPAQPIKPEGWSSQPRGCASLPTSIRNACDICQPLDAFLVDPARRTGEFCDTQTRRRHMERQLPTHLFDYRTDPAGRGGRNCQTLIVTKREKGADYRVAKDSYKVEVAAFERKLLPFRKEIFQKLLGDNLYRELVLLDQLPGSEAAQAARSNPPPAGIKREAQDDIVFPPNVYGIKREAQDDSIFPPAFRSRSRQ